jgi:hypothetical protein
VELLRIQLANARHELERLVIAEQVITQLTADATYPPIWMAAWLWALLLVQGQNWLFCEPFYPDLAAEMLLS